MRIIIELNGTHVETVEVRSAVAPLMSQEPPPELLAAARALGAQSAGIAAFSMPAGASEPLARRRRLSRTSMPAQRRARLPSGGRLPRRLERGREGASGRVPASSFRIVAIPPSPGSAFAHLTRWLLHI
jgi:hypothetical protein